MTEDQDALFSSVDALLRQADPLPAPEERLRLREAGGLARTAVAAALGVSAQTVAAWESGARDPQGERRAGYARLLAGLAERYPPPPPPSSTPAPDPEHTPATPAAPTAGVPEQQQHSPAGPAPDDRRDPARTVAYEPDRDRSGRLVTGPPEPCVLCGQPAGHRAAGRPQHCNATCAPGLPLHPAPAAPRSPAPSPSDARPARPAAAREETAGAIARNVAAALEDNGGDVDAALTALVKRAIPDAMALLNSTRVGSTYDFTNYLSTDDVPILKKPGRNDPDLIWEGRPKWRNTGAERGPARTVTALDANGAYLSALKTHLPIGTLRHAATGEYDRKRSGLYLITPPAWEHDDLPSPLGNREEPGPLWVTDPTLRLLIRLSGPRYGLCDPPVIHESWTSGSSEGLLERFRREMATARDAAIEAGDTVTLEYVKAMYAKFVSTIGESSANREMRRPDWMHIIRSQAFANLWLKAWKAYGAGLTVVRVTGTDELHLIGDWRGVFTEGRRLTDMKLKDEYRIGGR
ncbi:helix-turn-helix domain-containing protein [Streptomyces carpaticus]|uniref:helix-turn-helix domain-containing protein n=1 Tax=Streptomyces carpaticus TaxID=285558 RepID=UPI0021FAAA05|nr:helix-turn-helix domain-containing protein [Streptomyces carpaticus]